MATLCRGQLRARPFVYAYFCPDSVIVGAVIRRVREFGCSAAQEEQLNE